MSLTIHAEIHGLGGRATELRDLLLEHAGRLAGADGCLGAAAYAPLDGDAGEYVRSPAGATSPR